MQKNSWRVRGAPTWAWVSPAREAGRGAVGSHDPPSPSPSHTHISSALPSLGLCLDVRGYYSRRFHVQSFGHVFQVLIKLPRKNHNSMPGVKPRMKVVARLDVLRPVALLQTTTLPTLPNEVHDLTHLGSHRPQSSVTSRIEKLESLRLPSRAAPPHAKCHLDL